MRVTDLVMIDSYTRLFAKNNAISERGPFLISSMRSLRTYNWFFFFLGSE